MFGKILVRKEKGKVTVITKDFFLSGEEIRFKINGHVFCMFILESGKNTPDREFIITDIVTEEDDTLVARIRRNPHDYVVPLYVYSTTKVDGVGIMYEGCKPSICKEIMSLLQR